MYSESIADYSLYNIHYMLFLKLLGNDIMITQIQLSEQLIHDNCSYMALCCSIIDTVSMQILFNKADLISYY